MKVIFLDIDGVLNYEEFLLHEMDTKKDTCEHTIYLIDDTCLNNFQKIKESIQDLKICIISSWRRITKALDVLKNKNIYNPENDFLMDMNISKEKRIDEINDWLKRHTDVEKFVILDDEDDGYSLNNSENFVKTSFKSGLTSNLTELVISKLK